ncbi:unnamed protein product [Closterium sp. NIES-65]|nr:unnamed protein product [Closterium sp. NIES-65]
MRGSCDAAEMGEEGCEVETSNGGVTGGGGNKGFENIVAPELAPGPKNRLDAYLTALDKLSDALRFFEVHSYLGSCRTELRQGRGLMDDAVGRLKEEFGEVLSGASLVPDRKALVQSAACMKPGEVVQPVPLVRPEAVKQLRAMAAWMVGNEYEAACLRVYEEQRAAALLRCLERLGSAALTRDEVVALPWTDLEPLMKRWVENLKLTMLVLIAAEDAVCTDIIGRGPTPSPSARARCLTGVAVPALKQLHAFGDIIADMPRAPEHVFSLLEMVEALLDLRPAVEKQFPGEAGGEVRQHLVGICAALCRTVRGTIADFQHIVLHDPTPPPAPTPRPSLPSCSSTSSSSSAPFPPPPPLVSASGHEGGEERKGEEGGEGNWEEDVDWSHRSDSSHRSHHGGGGSHNRTVSGSASSGRGILGGLLPKKVSKGHEEGKGEARGKSKAEGKEGGGSAGQEVVVRGSPDVHPLTSYVVNFILLYFDETLYLGTLLLVYDEGGDQHEGAVRVGAATRHLLAALKANLERKGDAFHDEAMRAVFLMNNCEYIQRKVEEQHVKMILGRAWVDENAKDLEKHRDIYIRCIVNKVAGVLSDHRGDVAAFTKRVQALHALLEGVQAQQSGWSIGNADLRAFVRGEVASQVLLRYSDFLDRHRSIVESRACKVRVLTRQEVHAWLTEIFDMKKHG